MNRQQKSQEITVTEDELGPAPLNLLSHFFFGIAPNFVADATKANQINNKISCLKGTADDEIQRLLKSNPSIDLIGH